MSFATGRRRTQQCAGGFNPDGTRVTDVCNEADGYAGEYCSACASGMYRDNGRCRSCSENDAATRKSSVEFPFLVAGAVGLLSLLAVGIVFFTVDTLSNWVSKIVLIQQALYIGRNAGKVIDGPIGERIGEAFRNMSVLLLDVEFVKPACRLSNITFANVFWGTLVAYSVTAVVFAGAAALHASFMRRTCTRPSCCVVATKVTQSWWFIFRTRFAYSMIVLATLGYLQLCIRVFQALQCSGNQLVVELSNTCYSGSHTAVGGTAWVLLFLYCIEFPLGLFYHLIRAYHLKRMGEEADHMFGYYLQGVKPKWFWFRSASLVDSFALAALTVLVRNDSAKIFVGGVNFLFNFVLAGSLWPYTGIISNFLTILIGLLTGVQVAVYLHLFGRDSGNLSFFYAAVATFPLLVVLVTAARYRRLRATCRDHGPNRPTCRRAFAEDCCPKRTPADADEKLVGEEDDTSSSSSSSYSSSPEVAQAPEIERICTVDAGEVSEYSDSDGSSGKRRTTSASTSFVPGTTEIELNEYPFRGTRTAQRLRRPR